MHRGHSLGRIKVKGIRFRHRGNRPLDHLAGEGNNGVPMPTQMSGFLPRLPREFQSGGEANLEGVKIVCGTLTLLNSGVKGKV